MLNDERIQQLTEEVYRYTSAITGWPGLSPDEAIRTAVAEAVAAEREAHPIQPLALDDDGVLRFRANAIVEMLLVTSPLDLNRLAIMPFNKKDRQQFAQLIGYSLSGYGELSYVSDKAYERAERAAAVIRARGEKQ